MKTATPALAHLYVALLLTNTFFAVSADAQVTGCVFPNGTTGPIPNNYKCDNGIIVGKDQHGCARGIASMNLMAGSPGRSYRDPEHCIEGAIVKKDHLLCPTPNRNLPLDPGSYHDYDPKVNICNESKGNVEPKRK